MLELRSEGEGAHREKTGTESIKVESRKGTVRQEQRELGGTPAGLMASGFRYATSQALSASAMVAANAFSAVGAVCDCRMVSSLPGLPPVAPTPLPKL